MLKCPKKTGSFGRRFPRYGVTLIEMVLAVLIVSIIVAGAMNYQYFSTRMAKRANAELTAARTAALLMENWKSIGGDEFFNPVNLNMGFTQVPNSDRYHVTADDLPMTIDLSWGDEGVDAVAMTTLRRIQVEIRWRSDYRDDTIRQDDPVYSVATYVRRDQSGA